MIEAWKKNKTEELERIIRSNGKIFAKAFPGRSAILIKMLNLDEKNISAVFEKPGSKKIGYYVPGTRIPIQSDEVLFENMDQAPIILNLAWHIKDEIESYLRANHFKGKIVHILDDLGGI